MRRETDRENGSVQPEEVALLAEVISGSDRAWRRFIKQYEPALRKIVRESTDAIHTLTPAQLDDVMGDFWLRMVDDDRRWLRRFRGGEPSLEGVPLQHARAGSRPGACQGSPR